MNTKTKMLAAGVLMLSATFVLVGASAYARSGAGLGFTTGKHFSQSGSIDRGIMGPGIGRGFGMEDRILTNTGVRDLLQSKGVTLPSVDSLKQYDDAMRASRDAMAKLSDADRQAIEKATRDAMRAKGINLPSEDVIASMRTVQTQVRTVMQNLTPSERQTLMQDMHGNGAGFGGRSGMGMHRGFGR